MSSKKKFDSIFLPFVFNDANGRLLVWSEKSEDTVTLNWFDEQGLKHQENFPWTASGKKAWMKAESRALQTVSEYAEPKKRSESSNSNQNPPEAEPLDSDLAARTAMLFGLGYSRVEASNSLGIPFLQADAWDELWENMVKERRARKRHEREAGK